MTHFTHVMPDAMPVFLHLSPAGSFVCSLLPAGVWRTLDPTAETL